AFATQELGLPQKGHYRFYTDLDRPQVSWLVVATPALSLREHTFCYLIVGCLGYRGYFLREDADAMAAELTAQGLDVLVRPVRAYSTLGWFDDPVLNTFLQGPEVDVVGTVIHELAHRRYFLSGDTAFNESYATFVEEAGLERFLHRTAEIGGASPVTALERWRALQADEERFQTLVARTVERLEALYASDTTEEVKRREKTALFTKFREDYQSARGSFTLSNYEGWFAQALNNAHLVGMGHYTRYVRAFKALFAEQGGQFEPFYRAVEALGALPEAERRTRLAQLEMQGAKHPPNPLTRNP
ncbi:MAG: aminopeptidase, partial [Deltaproteobacteria bacterium]|nr:aminopeptidase [Deltaproteobacteria bacterium]